MTVRWPGSNETKRRERTKIDNWFARTRKRKERKKERKNVSVRERENII